MLHVKQKGLSPIGVLFVVCVFAFFVMIGLKLTPYYIDYNTIRAVYEEQSELPNIAQMSPGDIFMTLSKALTLNNIREFDIKSSTYLTDEQGNKVLGFSYEIREHLFVNIDVVLSFSYEKEIH